MRKLRLLVMAAVAALMIAAGWQLIPGFFDDRNAEAALASEPARVQPVNVKMYWSTGVAGATVGDVSVFGGGQYSVGADTKYNDQIWTVQSAEDQASDDLQVRNIPHPLGARHHMVAISDGNQVLFWGGREQPADESDSVIPEYVATGALFNPETSTWTDLPDAPLTLSDARGVFANGHFVIVGSTADQDIVMFSYNTTDNAWSAPRAIAAHSGGSNQVAPLGLAGLVAYSDGAAVAVSQSNQVTVHFQSVTGSSLQPPVTLPNEDSRYDSIELFAHGDQLWVAKVDSGSGRAAKMWQLSDNRAELIPVPKESLALRPSARTLAQDGAPVFQRGELWWAVNGTHATSVNLVTGKPGPAWQHNEHVNAGLILPRAEGYLRVGGSRILGAVPKQHPEAVTWVRPPATAA